MWLRLLQRHLHIHVYCSIIHNSQAMEIAKILHYRRWINKMWYLNTMEFYSATKKNEILSFASKWMELENIILSEVS
jgi:CDP-diacylglycerol pyrophosphatase